MRKVLLLVAVAAMLVPATAQSHRPHRAGTGPAAQACKAERDADPAAFKAKYANKHGRHAFRRCVRQHVRAARKKCREERAADREAFREKYGNERGRHAFRRCVRERADEPVG